MLAEKTEEYVGGQVNNYGVLNHAADLLRYVLEVCLVESVQDSNFAVLVGFLQHIALLLIISQLVLCKEHFWGNLDSDLVIFNF